MYRGSPPRQVSSTSLSSISDESFSDIEEGEIIIEKVVRRSKNQPPRRPPVQTPRSPSPEHSRKRKFHEKRTSKSRESDDSSDEKHKKKRKSTTSSKSKEREKTESPESSPERTSKVERELETYREFLKRKRHACRKNPEEHPIYKLERNEFLSRQPTGRDKRDVLNECDKHWHKRMKEFDEELIRARRSELHRKYRIMDVDERIAKAKKHEDKSDADKRKRKSKSSESSSPPRPHYLALMTHTRLAGTSKKQSPGSVPESGALLKAAPEKKEAVNEKPQPPLTAQSIPLPPDSPPRPASSESVPVDEADSSPNLLQILTLLAALEDNLGSLGATVTVVLSRVLSVERQQPGTSSCLVRDVVDLIDTSKAKLIGQLEMGLIEGARAKAAQSTVNKITRFLQSLDQLPPRPLVPIPIRLTPPVPSPPPLMPLYPEDEEMLCHGVSTDDGSVNSSTNLGPQINSPCQETKNDGNNNNNNSSSSSKEVGRAEVQEFTGDEVLTLIQNFAVLKEAQKCDLIRYLRRLEGVSSKGAVRHASAESSGKSRAVESASECLKSQRLPVIYSMTGLTASELEKLGLPVDDIVNRRTSSGEREQLDDVTIVESPSTSNETKEVNGPMPSSSKLAVKRDPRLNHSLRRARKEQMKPCQ